MSMHQSVPDLFAAARGLPRGGPARCFYCGASCGTGHLASQWVRDTFSGHDGVRCPGSDHVCAGCVACLDEKAEIELADGERRTGQKTRMYSWLITPRAATAATKSHMAWMRQTIERPPDEPWALVLATSGQKHLLYRGRVNAPGADAWWVSLEEEVVLVEPSAWRDAMAAAMRVAAATGKPRLAEPACAATAIAMESMFGDGGSSPLSEWESLRESPLGRLVAFVCPAKEQCREHFGVEDDRLGGGEAAGRRARDGGQGSLF